MTAFISCQSIDKTNTGNKEKLGITVEVVPEGDSSYSISWKDTLGKSKGYGLDERPSEVWCFIVDNIDTVGHYRGLSTPTNYTYFLTKDTTVKVTFMIGPNVFSKHGHKGARAEEVIEFNPIDLNLKSRVRKPVEFVLTETRKLPLTSAL